MHNFQSLNASKDRLEIPLLKLIGTQFISLSSHMIAYSFGMEILNSCKVLQVRQNVVNGIVTFLLSTIPIDFAVVKMGSKKLELVKKLNIN